MTKIEARKITLEEAETYRRIGGYSYGFWRDELDEWTPEPDELNTRLAVFCDGTMTAKLVNIRYEQIVRGQWHSAGGIGGVATLPEFRRQGHVRKLMDATFADMQEAGMVVSALYPFSHAFYAKFGYVRTNPIPRVRFDSASLNHLIPLVDEAGETWRYQRIPAIQGVEQYKQFLHQVAQQPNRPEYNGYMRDPGLDAGDLANEHMVFVWRNNEQNGSEEIAGEEIVGAALYRTEKYANPEGGTLINDYHWRDSWSRDRLLAFMALHGAGMPKVQVSVSPSVNFHGWLSETPNPYEVKMGNLPLMVRVMDVAQVLTGIQIGSSPSNQSMVIQVEDDVCPWVGGTFAVIEREGILDAFRSEEIATIHMTIEGLTALVYGTLPVAEIVYKGWITGANAEEVALLDRWFPEQSVFNLLGF